MRLNELQPKAGERNVRMRVGRGIGSGKGKTAAKGHKGQKSRSGVSINGFEGGQMPLHRRLPKRGFHNLFRKRFCAVNVGRLQTAVDAGKLDADKTIDAAALQAAGIVTHLRDGVRLLGQGELKAKLDIAVSGASKSAAAAIEKTGGKLSIVGPLTRSQQKKSSGKGDSGA